MSFDADRREVRHIERMTWPEIEEAVQEQQTMLLPVGSTEQHGHHLPLGVDVYIPVGLCTRVARRTGCFLAPPIWYGVAPHHHFKPGVLSIGSEAFSHYVRDVCVSANRWGVENVILVDGHGIAQGSELGVTIKQLRNELGMRAFHLSPVALCSKTAAELRESERSFHGAEFETSAMLALQPDLVDMDVAKPEVPEESPLPFVEYDIFADSPVSSSLAAEDMDRLTETGAIGDPTVASADKGEQMLDEAEEKLSRLIEALEADDEG